jgi:hypothetical protein
VCHNDTLTTMRILCNVSLRHDPEELVDLLDGMYGAGATQLIPTTDEPSTSALNQRLSALIAELRVTREALLASQRRADAQLTDQEVRLSTVEGLLNNRMTTLAGQLDETQQRLLDQVKITAAQQSVIRLAIERLGKRYETKTGTRIYDRLHARFCAELGTPRYDARPLANTSRRSTGYALVRLSICQTILMRFHHYRRAYSDDG